MVKQRHRIASVLLILGVVVMVLMTFVFHGIPVPSEDHFIDVAEIVSGNYSPRNNTLVPTERLEDAEQILAELGKAQQRIVLPTLGSLQGPAVLLDNRGRAIVALFFQIEHGGLVAHEVVGEGEHYKIRGPITGARGVIQRAWMFDLFTKCRGHWSTIEEEERLE